MAGSEFLDEWPDLFFKSLKRQMLLGRLPSETVEEILAPVLKNYDTAMTKLPPGLRSEIEDILRIYEEIAEKYDLKPSPSMTAVLDSLWEGLKEAFTSILERQVAFGFTRDGSKRTEKSPVDDLLPRLRDIALNLPHHAAGNFTTDEGNRVLIVLNYEEKADRFCFRHSGFSGTLHVYLCGRHVLSLQSGEGQHCVTLGKILQVFEDSQETDMEIEIREQEDP